MRVILFVLLLLFCFAKNSFANDTIIIQTDLYQIDHSKKLILISREDSWINTQWPDRKTHIFLDHYYQFSMPVNDIETGMEYSVSYGIFSYKLFFTNLPVIAIATPNTIDDDIKVSADFQLAEANGDITTSGIGIEYRGASTSWLPKKSFLLELWNDPSGSDKGEMSLLNMRTDGDWILTAMYNEPLRIRSKTCSDLWLKIHEPYYKAEEPDAQNGVRSEYVELFLNHHYQGVYRLGERVDRKQLKLKKHDGQIRGELYKGVGWGGSTYHELIPYSNVSETWNGFEYEHPEEEINWANLYAFVNFVINSTDQQFYTHHHTQFNLENAVDYFIFLNLLRAIDNTGKNIYVAKYKKNQPYFFVPWDLDGVLGLSWDGTRLDITDDLLSNGFYDRLIADCNDHGFTKRLQQRWTELRASTLTHAALTADLSANHHYLVVNGVYKRERIAWPAFHYEASELSYMSTWLTNRLNYLDDRFSGPCEELQLNIQKPSPETIPLHVHPNPVENFIHIVLDQTQLPAELSILNSTERPMFNTSVHEQKSELDLSELPPGLYIIRIKHTKGVQTKKFLKY